VTALATAPAQPTRVRGDACVHAAAQRRTLLQQLLNHEGATRTGAAWPRLARRVRPPVARAMAALSDAVPPRTLPALRRQLAAAFAQAPATGADGGAAATETVVVAPLPTTLRAHREPGFAALVAAARTLHAWTGARVLLHGSLASDDWTGYRDADLLVLVPEASCGDERALERLRTACLPLLTALHRFDPLQHHGLFVAPATDLLAWPEHVLPLATLRRCLDLGGDGATLAVRPNHDLAAAHAELRWLVDHFDRSTPPRDAYGWKAFASVLMLLPAIWLGARGRPVWKGDSFAAVRPHVPPHLWQPITWATALRAGWTDATPRWLRLLLAVAPSARVVALAARRLVPAPPHLLPADPDHLLRTVRALAHWLCEHRDPTEPRP
jgi:hypothetical protein